MCPCDVGVCTDNCIAGVAGGWGQRLGEQTAEEEVPLHAMAWESCVPCDYNSPCVGLWGVKTPLFFCPGFTATQGRLMVWKEGT